MTGLSGVFNSLIYYDKGAGFWWKFSFFAGLISAPTFAAWIWPNSHYFDSYASVAGVGGIFGYLFAGLFVGFGARMMNGCESGHMFCEIPRLSKRSIVAGLGMVLSGMGMANMRYHLRFLYGGPTLSAGAYDTM